MRQMPEGKSKRTQLCRHSWSITIQNATKGTATYSTRQLKSTDRAITLRESILYHRYYSNWLFNQSPKTKPAPWAAQSTESCRRLLEELYSALLCSLAHSPTHSHGRGRDRLPCHTPNSGSKEVYQKAVDLDAGETLLGQYQGNCSGYDTWHTALTMDCTLA